jgi:predicted NACHT family NTPase
VRREQDTLRLRNAIYAEVFNRRWVQAHWPVHWIKRIPSEVFGLIAALLAIVVLLAMFARTQQQLAQQQQEAAEKAEAVAKEQQRLRLISLTQALAARALRKHDDRGALLARQAYLFHQQRQGHVLDQIDDALRTILSVPYFSHILRGHEKEIYSVALSPDGQSLASGSADNTIRLWDLRHPAAALTVLRGHGNAVSSVAFSPDGQTLASGSGDQTIRIWIARTEILAGKICQQVWRNLTLDEWRRFVGVDLPYERTCPNLVAGAEVPAEVPGTTP